MLVREVGRRNNLFMKSFRLSVENIVCRFCVSPFLFLYAISPVGCSYYSTSEGMIGGIRTLTIPVAESFTAEFAVAERLSERATELYMEDGRLRIVDQDGAEAVLYLTVLGISDEPFTYSSSEQTEQYRFSLVINGKIVHASSEKRILKEFDSIEGWATYSADSNQDEGRNLAIEKAVDMVVQELINRSTGSW